MINPSSSLFSLSRQENSSSLDPKKKSVNFCDFRIIPEGEEKERKTKGSLARLHSKQKNLEQIDLNELIEIASEVGPVNKVIKTLTSNELTSLDLFIRKCFLMSVPDVVALEVSNNFKELERYQSVGVDASGIEQNFRVAYLMYRCCLASQAYFEKNLKDQVLIARSATEKWNKIWKSASWQSPENLKLKAPFNGKKTKVLEELFKKLKENLSILNKLMNEPDALEFYGKPYLKKISKLGLSLKDDKALNFKEADWKMVEMLVEYLKEYAVFFPEFDADKIFTSFKIYRQDPSNLEKLKKLKNSIAEFRFSVKADAQAGLRKITDFVANILQDPPVLAERSYTEKESARYFQYQLTHCRNQFQNGANELVRILDSRIVPQYKLKGNIPVELVFGRIWHGLDNICCYNQLINKKDFFENMIKNLDQQFFCEKNLSDLENALFYQVKNIMGCDKDYLWTSKPEEVSFPNSSSGFVFMNKLIEQAPKQSAVFSELLVIKKKYLEYLEVLFNKSTLEELNSKGEKILSDVRDRITEIAFPLIYFSRFLQDLIKVKEFHIYSEDRDQELFSLHEELVELLELEGAEKLLKEVIARKSISILEPLEELLERPVIQQENIVEINKPKKQVKKKDKVKKEKIEMPILSVEKPVSPSFIKVKNVTFRDLQELLKEVGGKKIRQNGSHGIWDINSHRVVLPQHNGKTIAPGTVHSIVKQVEVAVGSVEK